MLATDRPDLVRDVILLAAGGKVPMAPEIAASLRTCSGPVDDWWQAGGKPVLILQPACDIAAVPENARDLARAIGDRAHLVEIPHAGHAALPEQPEAISEAVLAFLDR